MITKIAAALALVAGLGFIGAASAAEVVESTTPVYWGSTGAEASMNIYYTGAGSGAVTVVPKVTDIAGYPLSFQVYGCTPVNQQAGVYIIQPGGYCLVVAYGSAGTNASIIASADVVDGTKKTTNILTNVRASLEMVNGNHDVLTHVDLH